MLQLIDPLGGRVAPGGVESIQNCDRLGPETGIESGVVLVGQLPGLMVEFGLPDL